MIFDKIENKDKYFSGEIFNEIFRKLEDLSLELPDGNYYKTDDYYFKVISYDTKHNPTIIESHRKEVDVQIMISGSEKIKIYSPENLIVKSEYDKNIDCTFYKNTGKEDVELELSKGKMAVFFPQDIHACQFAVNSKIKNIKKIVIKIDEKLFT